VKDLLALVHKSAEALRRKFTCPRLGVELEVRLLPANEVAAAYAEASREWGDKEVRHGVDEKGLALLTMRAQVARAIYHDGERVSRALLDALDEPTLRRWAAEYATLEDAVDPPLEKWTSEQVDELVEGLKKKAPGYVASLRLFDGPTLIGLLLFMADRLARSETSISSTATPDTTSPS
jgi:hypothetical protein